MKDPFMEAVAAIVFNRENGADILAYLMNYYAKQSVENALAVHKMADSILDMMYEKMAEKLAKSRQACEMLVFQHGMEAEDCGGTTELSAMVPVCMTMYPDGFDTPGIGKTDRDYLRWFNHILRNRRHFSFDSPNDARWADTWGYTEYLKKMLSQEVPDDD